MQCSARNRDKSSAQSADYIRAQSTPVMQKELPPVKAGAGIEGALWKSVSIIQKDQRYCAVLFGMVWLL